jgi:hypothetical protein
MPVFLHSTDPELYRDKRASEYVEKKLTKKYAKSGAFAKTVRDDAKFNLFLGLLDQLETELTKFQTYYQDYSTQDFEGAPSTRRKKRTSSKKDITLVRGEIGLGSIVGLIKRCERILSSYPNFNTLNPRDIATLTKSYEDLMVFISGFQDLTESTDDYRTKLQQAREELENWNPTDYEDEFIAEDAKQQLQDFVRNARLSPPQRIQGVANAFYADLYNFLVAFRTKLNIYETDPENKTPTFGRTASASVSGSTDDDGDDGDNHGKDALQQEGYNLDHLSVDSVLQKKQSYGRVEPHQTQLYTEYEPRLSVRVLDDEDYQYTLPAFQHSKYGISNLDVLLSQPSRERTDLLAPVWTPQLRLPSSEFVLPFPSRIQQRRASQDELFQLLQEPKKKGRPVVRGVPRPDLRQQKGRYDIEVSPKPSSRRSLDSVKPRSRKPRFSLDDARGVEL